MNEIRRSQDFRPRQRAVAVLVQLQRLMQVADVEIDEATRAAVEQGGRGIVEAFFDLAQARSPAA